MPYPPTSNDGKLLSVGCEINTVDLGEPPSTAVVNQAQLKLGLALRASILTYMAIVACALRLLSDLGGEFDPS